MRKNTGAMILILILLVISLLTGSIPELHNSFLALAAEAQAIIIFLAISVLVISIIIFIRGLKKNAKKKKKSSH
jgi:amino acid transporter